MSDNIIMFDSCSDAIFESDAAKLREVVDRINKRLLDEQRGLTSIDRYRIVREELGYNNPNDGLVTLDFSLE